MSATWCIGLVARREIRERWRSKGQRIAFVLVLAAMVALTVLPKFLESSSSADVGVVGTIPNGFDATLTATSTSSDSSDDAVVVTGYPDTGAGEAALDDGTIDLLWDPGADQLVWNKGDEPSVATRVRVAATRAQFDANAAQLGLSSQQQSQLLTPPALTDRSLQPSDADEGARTALALGGTILLFIAISLFGGFVLTGVVTEKTSRIAEVLLAQVEASHLLAGKVLGIGALALAELIALGVAVLVAGQVAGTIPLPSVGLAAIVTTIGFFILGFAIYATLYAAAGALVNRQEDAQAVTYPVMLPLLAGYLVAVTTISEPDNPVGVILSLFPLTAPVEMPLRIQLGDVPAWQVVASVLLCLAFIWVIIVIAGRVYAGALLRTGGRVKVRDALRAADDLTAR